MVEMVRSDWSIFTSLLCDLQIFLVVLEGLIVSAELVLVKIDQSDREGMAYGNIGIALKSHSRYDEALEYYKKNLEIAQQAGE
jgi:tetratricopeptide (TPR) repeat protein